MIPYFQFTGVSVGPVRLQAWGFFVALGILVAAIVGRRLAKKRGLNETTFLDFASWAVIGGIIGARLLFAVAYSPPGFWSDHWAVFRVWDGGMSIYGAFIGAALCGWLFLRWLAPRPVVPMIFDIAAYVLPLGCAIGRIGCFLIHDHPGIKSNFFLAVAYPDGGRLDLGLLLSLLNAAIFVGFVVWRRVSRGWPPFLGAYFIFYGVCRFFLDFLRATDITGADMRYFGLTPAQYLSVVGVVLGILLVVRRARSKEEAV